MEKATTRRSDRIAAELAIQVMGTDGMGKGFMDETKTLILSRHGAKILLSCKLVPEQEITIRCLSTNKEADARVVGQIGEGAGAFHYGIEFLDPQVNVWDIDFPQLSESEKAVARVLLECHHCHSRELTYLDEFEAEVFEVNRCLSRPCQRCGDTSIWKLSAVQVPPEQIAPPIESRPVENVPPPAPVRTQNERQSLRIGLKMMGCIVILNWVKKLSQRKTFRGPGFRSKAPDITGPNMPSRPQSHIRRADLISLL